LQVKKLEDRIVQKKELMIMKVRTADPYNDPKKYTLKQERVFAFHARKAVKFRENPTKALPTLSERFITVRTYQTKCARLWQILSVFSSLLLLPVALKSVRLAMKGKKIVTSHTFSTKQERLRLHISFSRIPARRFPFSSETAAKLVIAEKLCEWSPGNTDLATKLKELNDTSAEKAQADDLTAKLLDSFDEAVNFIDARELDFIKTSRPATRFGVWSPQLQIAKKELADKLFDLAKRRLANKEFNEMDALDKRLWELTKRMTVNASNCGPLIIKSDLYLFLCEGGKKAEGFLKDLCQTRPNVELQVDLVRRGIIE